MQWPGKTRVVKVWAERYMRCGRIYLQFFTAYCIYVVYAHGGAAGS